MVIFKAQWLFLRHSGIFKMLMHSQRCLSQGVYFIKQAFRKIKLGIIQAHLLLDLLKRPERMFLHIHVQFKV